MYGYCAVTCQYTRSISIIWIGGESSGGEPASITAMGLRLEMCLAEERSTGTSEHYLAILDCNVGDRKVPGAGIGGAE